MYHDDLSLINHSVTGHQFQKVNITFEKVNSGEMSFYFTEWNKSMNICGLLIMHRNSFDKINWTKYDIDNNMNNHEENYWYEVIKLNYRENTKNNLVTSNPVTRKRKSHDCTLWLLLSNSWLVLANFTSQFSLKYWITTVSLAFYEMADATTTEATENGAIYHETPPYQVSEWPS